MTDLKQPDTAPSLANNERFMKRLVIVLGILLIAGFVVLIAGIAVRVAKRGAEVPAEVRATQEPGSASVALNGRIPLPKGATLANMTATDTTLYLHLQESDGQQTILIIDARTGAVAGKLELGPE